MTGGVLMRVSVGVVVGWGDYLGCQGEIRR